MPRRLRPRAQEAIRASSQSYLDRTSDSSQIAPNLPRPTRTIDCHGSEWCPLPVGLTYVFEPRVTDDFRKLAVHAVARGCEAVEKLNHQERPTHEDVVRVAPVGDVQLTVFDQEGSRGDECLSLLIAREVVQNQARDDPVERARFEGRLRCVSVDDLNIAIEELVVRQSNDPRVGVETHELRAWIGGPKQGEQGSRPATEI